MLSSIVARSCKQNRICQCKTKLINTRLKISETRTQIHIKRLMATGRIQHAKKPTLDNPSVQHACASKYTLRALSTDTNSKDIGTNNRDKRYHDVLSVAIDQSNVSIAQSLIDTTFMLLRKGNVGLAWECYLDLTSRKKHKHISREQYRQLIKHFNHKQLNNEQGLEHVLTLVEDMKRLGYQVGRKEKLMVLRLLGTNGNIAAMEKVFDDLSKEQLLEITDLAAAQKPFNIMLTAYFDHSSINGGIYTAKKAMELYGEMLDRNIQPSEATTGLLLKDIRKGGKSDEVVENVWNWVWTKIGMNVGGKTKEIEPSLYRGMVMYFASVGRAEYALEINDIMAKKKIPHTVISMTALIHKVGRAGDINKSMDLLNEMVVVEGLVPTVVTFNSLIDIHAHSKPEPDVEGANRMYSMMLELGLQPSIITFSILIDMFAKKGDLAGVKKFYKEMVEKHCFVPSPYVYSSLIEYYIKVNDRNSVMEILSLLKKQVYSNAPPARETYNLMFKGLVQNNQIAEGIDLLGVMIKNKMKLDSRTFTPLLTYFAKRGDTEGAHKVADMMTQAKVFPNQYTYSCLLESHAKAGDIEGAEDIFNTFKKLFRPKAHIYNSLLYVYTKRNEMEKVLETYKRMTKSHIPADVYTYGILMNFYSRRKELKAVEALMETMQKNNITPSIACWTILMQTYFECQRPDEGRRLIERITQAGLTPSDVTWSVLISGCIQSNELEFAESILEETIEKAKQALASSILISDKDLDLEQGYESLIPETIEDVLKKTHNTTLPKFTVSPYLFTAIIDAHSKSGGFDQAKSLIKTMNDLNVPITVVTYTTIMNVFKRERRFDIVELLWNALSKPSSQQSFVENVDPMFPKLPLPEKTYTYTNLLTLNDDNLEEMKTVEDRVTPFAVSIYLDSLFEENREDDIRALWQHLTHKNYRFDEQNWNRYITFLIGFGKLDEACTLAYDVFLEPKSKNDGDDRTKTFKSVRKREDISMSNDYQINTRTCVSFANALQIAGAENMGEPRLRAVVNAKIEEYIRHKNTFEIIS
ncbi:hypothetical protein BD408DRAFT_448297 [Parasitella parasitica]|nr:hypothetical protein BD408DRAFT_448297 [Parasitella parasitica]